MGRTLLDALRHVGSAQSGSKMVAEGGTLKVEVRTMTPQIFMDDFERTEWRVRGHWQHCIGGCPGWRPC